MKRLLPLLLSPLVLIVAALGCGTTPEPVSSPTPPDRPRAARGAPSLPLAGRRRGTEDARDDQGAYQVEARYQFWDDGTVTAEMDFPDPIGRQPYTGEFRLLADVLEVRLSRWGEVLRRFKVTISGDVMTWQGEEGNTTRFVRLK